MGRGRERRKDRVRLRLPLVAKMIMEFIPFLVIGLLGLIFNKLAARAALEMQEAILRSTFALWYFRIPLYLIAGISLLIGVAKILAYFGVK